MRKLFQSITLLSSLAISTVSFAGHHYDYAKVTSVEPVYELVSVTTPEKTCYRVREKHRHYNPAPTIVGAVVGGVIGRAIGDNRHTRKIGSVIGSTVGASIGHDISHQNAHSQYRTVKHCEVSHYQKERVKELRGYNVQYRYKGEIYDAFMRNHPGKRVKLKVSVRPAYID